MIKILNYQISKTSKQKQYTNDQIIEDIFKNKVINIFDVGANIGQSIDRFKKIFDENANIYAFEPQKNCYDQLLNKFGNYNKVKAFNVLVSNECEDIVFNISSNKNNTQSSVYEYENTKYTQVNNLKMVKKEIIKKERIIKLDDFCNKYKINQIDFLKIDTQGSEVDVLKSAEQLILNKKIKILEIEMNFSEKPIYKNTSVSFYNIESILNNNYRLFAIPDRGNILSNVLYSLNVLYIEKNFFEEVKKNSKISVFNN